MTSTYGLTIPKGTAQMQAITNAINQGIDSRLNAVFFYIKPTELNATHLSIEIRDSKSLAVLMYRLWEASEDKGCRDSEDWFFAICDTLGLDDPWLVDNFTDTMPEIYYGSYEKVGTQFIGPLDEVIGNCLERGSAPTGIMMQA